MTARRIAATVAGLSLQAEQEVRWSTPVCSDTVNDHSPQGADRLTVLPYDAGRESAAQYPQAFGRRIARNVQHLLQLESGLGDIADPAAGSYYVEQLTRQLAAAAWNDFVKS